MLGISFLPGQQSQTNRQNATQPLQQAVQMLSLRMPRVTGANAIAPDLLLQQRQPGAPLPPVPGTPEWEELMRRWRDRFAGPQQPGQPPSPPPSPPPPMPPPHWTPILGPDDSPVGPPRPEVPSKPLPDVPTPFSAMFNHLGTRMY